MTGGRGLSRVRPLSFTRFVGSLERQYGDGTLGFEDREMNGACGAVTVLAQYGFEVGNGETATSEIAMFDLAVADENLQWRVDQPLHAWHEAHPRQRGVGEQEADQRGSGSEP